MTSTAAGEAPEDLQAAIASEVTAGGALRRAREARGLHIAALAATLKVPQSKLEALEADRYHELPDATFARGLARSMCRVLKIEAEPVLAMLPRGGHEAALDRVTPGLNQPFRERAASQEPMISAALLKSPVLLGGAALLLAALAVYLVPASVVDDLTRRFHREPDTAAQPGTTTEPLQVEAPTLPASAPLTGDPTVPATGDTAGATAQDIATPAQAPGAQASAVIATPAVPATTVPSGSATTAPVATTAPAATASPAAASTAGAAAPAGASLLRVRATGDTWVEVVDSQGQTLVSRLLRTGEQVDLNGTAPLRLRVGNVSGTELVFRGKPVDLASRARDNVARLELN